MKKIIRLTESDLYRIVKRVLKEEETDEYIPTGEPSSDGKSLYLDVNPSIGILDDEYYLNNEDSVFSNYDKTKKIPNGKEYFIERFTNINGYKVKITNRNYLTIKDNVLLNYTWKDLFDKINNISISSPNDLLSDEDDIFRSLLSNSVPSFEIDKESYGSIFFKNNTGVIDYFGFELKPKNDDTINYVWINLDATQETGAWVYPSSGSEYSVNVVWDGNDLSFTKSSNPKLIIKV
jgi:hypothetical protein